MPSIGPLELVILLVIVLVIFGPKRLPSLGRQLGSGMREFKDSLTSKSSKDDDEGDADTALGRPELSRAEAADPLTPAPDPTREPVGERDEQATRRGA
ncbi:MAG: twin-arginine translocase TatA/TatE family subunit [Solirubrobacterales bacterium]|nr:twin-arginine translocase TatA/TatE family subunit [Solirubrobacterales bacterium]